MRIPTLKRFAPYSGDSYIHSWEATDSQGDTMDCTFCDAHYCIWAIDPSALPDLNGQCPGKIELMEKMGCKKVKKGNGTVEPFDVRRLFQYAQKELYHHYGERLSENGYVEVASNVVFCALENILHENTDELYVSAQSLCMAVICQVVMEVQQHGSQR